jgi:transcription antitermination factor NusG
MQLVCRRGIQAFTPVRHYMVRPGGQGPRLIRYTSLCPGYLFVKLPVGFAELYRKPIPMALGLVGIDGEPSPIPERDIAYLQVISGRSDRVARLIESLNVKRVIPAVLRHVEKRT